MDFDIQNRKIVFNVDGVEYSQEEIKKMIAILTDLAETNAYEWPYRGEDLASRAISLVKRSKK